MDINNTGFCLLCLKELREGLPSSNERPLFFTTCPLYPSDGYPHRCPMHFSYSGLGNPPNFFKVRPTDAKNICHILFKRKIIQHSDIPYLINSMKLI